MSLTRALPRPGREGATPRLGTAFRTLVAGQGLGQLGDGLSQVAFAQLVIFDIGRGATPGRIAGIFAVTLLPFSLVGPLAGVFIDRWDRRRTLIAASLCRAGLATAAVAAALWRSEALAYVGVVLLLSSSRFVLDAKGAVLPRTVAAADLVRANSVSALLGMGAAFTGAVGASTFVSRSVFIAFLAGAGAYAAASACFTRLPDVGGGEPRGSVGAALRRLAGEVCGGAAVIARTAELREPMAAVALHRTVLGGGFVLLVLVADRRYHLEASGYGLAIAVTGVAAVAGTVAAPWLSRRWPSRSLLPVAFLPAAAAAAAVGYGPTLPGLVAVVAVAAIAFQALKILADALIGGAAPDAVRGRIFALYDVFYNVAFVLAGLVMVPLWHLGRERALLWWLGAAFGTGWLLTARSVGAWPFGGRPRDRVPVPGKWRLRAVALFAGGVVVVVFPQPAVWQAAWFALIPWLIVVRRAPSAREAAVRGFWAAVGFLVAVHYWLLPSTTVFLPVIAAVVAVLWLPWAALSWRLLSGKLAGRRLLAAVTVVPAGWVVVEAARSWSALGGPEGLLGASQWRSPVFLAPASLGGVWLSSYLIVACNVALVAVIETSHWRMRAAAGVVAVALVAAGPIWFALQRPPSGAAAARVAVVQAGVVPGAARRLSDEIAQTERLPPGPYAVVAWGESSVAIDVLTRPEPRRRLQALAGRLGSDLLVNVDAKAPSGAIRKTAVLLDAHGIAGTYQKMRLVPFGEYIPMRPVLGWLSAFTKAAAVDRVRGHRVEVLRAGTLRFAPLICFESAFPDMSRTAVRRGARLLIFQSAVTTFQNTWAPDQQASLAAVRAVETGRPAVQASLAGTTAAFDARGDRLVWHPAATGAVLADLPLAARTTPYDRFGDWVPAACVVVVAGAAVASSLRAAGAGRRPNPG